MRICVVGLHSFLERGPKVGTQHIAETLADVGHDVVYVAGHVSPAAAVVPSLRARLRASRSPVRLGPRLTQVTPVNLVPARVLQRLEDHAVGRALERMNRRAERSRGGHLERAAFDVCIYSAASTLTLVERIRARRVFYRMNDLLAGFRGVPKSLLARESALLRSGGVHGVWAVNEQLAAHARQLAPAVPVRVIPNGVATALFDAAPADPELARTRDRNVIFVGAVEYWIDVELLLATARLLAGHRFHVYGPWLTPQPSALPPNVLVHGPLPHGQIAAKMKACAVGVIPAAPSNAARMVETPIKFYEYLAAGLGVAATSHAGTALGRFAAIGDSPEAFARAITEAPAVAQREREAVAAAVRGRDWRTLVAAMLEDV